MATELVYLVTTREPTTEEFQHVLNGFYPTPAGFHEARWAKSYEDSQLSVGLFTWDSVEDHLNYARTPQFSAVVETAIKPLPMANPLKVFHVYFEQGIPTFESASIVELITLKRQDGDFSVVAPSLEPFVNFASQKGLSMVYYGSVHEDVNEFIIFLGWDSLEAREAVQTDEIWVKFAETISFAERKSHLLSLYPFRTQKGV